MKHRLSLNPYRREEEKPVGPEIIRRRRAARPHKIPRSPSDHQKMVPPTHPPPPRLPHKELPELHGHRIPRLEISLSEHARPVQATVERDVEHLGRLRRVHAARVPVRPGVEYHLGDELVGCVPGGVEGAAEAAVGHVRAHVGVDVEVAAAGEEGVVEVGREGVDVERGNAWAALGGRFFERVLTLRRRRGGRGLGDEEDQDEEEPEEEEEEAEEELGLERGEGVMLHVVLGFVGCHVQF